MSDPVRGLADAVLYEGYLLWPYRRSATKNQRRWTFGGVFPEAWCARAASGDAWRLGAELLLEAGGDAAVEVELRFLHVVDRQVLRAGASGLEPVDELVVGGERHLSWDEATERRVSCAVTLPALLREPSRVPIAIAAGEAEEPLRDADGRPAGALVRRWRELVGAVEVGAEQVGEGVVRLWVGVVNTTPWDGDDREQALRRSLVSTHLVLRARGGEFVSPTDPPAALAGAAAGCASAGLWPVLVGEPGDRSTVLAAPIILSDYPQIAPESPGDLFDATEIDGLLTLSILSLTEEEQREMRASDPRARRILERTEALSHEELRRLHGAMREFGELRR